MISTLQTLKQTRDQAAKLRSWVDKLPTGLREELERQVIDIIVAVDAALEEQE